MEINASNNLANTEEISTATAAKPLPVEDATKLNQASTTDTVTLSAEATAAAEETETPIPQHGGGGVVIPPVKD